MSDHDEFYVGWEERAPMVSRARFLWLVVFLLSLTTLLGIFIAAAQRTIGVSVFEWGTVKSFDGILRSQPYPHLLVGRPGGQAGQTPFSAYYLVKPLKFGLEPEVVSKLDGKRVDLKGTLIYREGQTMIEVVDGSIKAADPSGENSTASHFDTPVSLGEQTLIGEIVDSKCFLGVMNPGAFTPHRGCAIRCISGGIPPVLVVRQQNGTLAHFLLVSREGKPVNKQVLNLVAEPVAITGEVQRQGGLLILRADPANYRRLP